MRLAPFVLAVLVCTPFSAAQEPAPAPKKDPLPPAVQQGYELIHQGKLAEALAQFRTLATEMPNNKWSAKAIRPLTQAVQLEKIVALDEHPKWLTAADWLHRFYTSNKVPTKLLALTQRASQRFPDDAQWSVRLATALSENGKSKEALDVYRKLVQKHDEPGLRAMAAVLAARGKDAKTAQEMLAGIPADCPDPVACYNAACAYALLKDVAHAGALLQRSFEQTPPSQLHATKRQAMFDEDLDALTGTDVLARALEAESKVPEPSKTPASCEGCPSKGSCDKEEEGGCEDEKKK